ncbi:MAG: S9 family peptidase, partial [Bdellovibrionota bacterium]
MKNTSIAQTVSIYFLVFGLVGCVTQSKPGSSPATGGSASSYSGVGAESVSPEVLAKYAPSALPKELAGRVRNLLEVQSPGLGALSVDGKTMYFTWTVSGVNQIWKIDGPLRFPEQLTSGEDPTLINEITADGKYLIVSRDRAGEENPGLYLMPTAGGEMIEIFHKKNVRTSFAFLTTDNETIFYTANDIKAESFALYGYSMSTRKRELLMSEPGVWYVA